MATPPFEPDETKPASSDLISAFPAAEQTFRDIIEDWLLTISTSSGVLKSSAFPAVGEFSSSVSGGTTAGSFSDVSGFGQPLNAITTGNTAVTIETTDSSGMSAILFNVGTTAFGQIRYLHASEDMTFYTNNTLRATLDEDGLALVGDLLASAGSTGNPSITFLNDSNTGFWNDGNTSITFCLNGTDRVRFDANGITTLVNGDGFRGQAGSASAPTFTFENDTNTGIYSHTNNGLAFATSGAGKMALNDDGTLTVSPPSHTDITTAGVDIFGAGASGGAGGIRATRTGFATLYLNRLSSNGNIVEFYRQSDFIAAISITTSAVTYNTTSDARRKENPRDFDSGAMLDALPMVQFDWKDGSGSAYGAMVNEDIATVIPTAFSHDVVQDVWMADYSKMVPILWAEVRDLRNRVRELEYYGTN